MRINELVKRHFEQFPDPDTAKLDAELLMAHALNKTRTWLRAFDDTAITREEEGKIVQLFQRRIEGEPVAYILGEWEFFSLPLKVSPATLIPRPETELLVEYILKQIEQKDQPRILDLGTGSGAIAIALKNQRIDAEVMATDFSIKALEVAQQNAAALGLSVEFSQGSWWQAVDSKQKFDVIVSNPPYVAEDDPHITNGDLRFEPLSALTAGKDEFADLKHIIEYAPYYLKNDGVLAVEHGYNQGVEVKKIFENSGFSAVKTHKDYQKNDRFTSGINAAIQSE